MKYSQQQNTVLIDRFRIYFLRIYFPSLQPYSPFIIDVLILFISFKPVSSIKLLISYILSSSSIDFYHQQSSIRQLCILLRFHVDNNVRRIASLSVGSQSIYEVDFCKEIYYSSNLPIILCRSFLTFWYNIHLIEFPLTL